MMVRRREEKGLSEGGLAYIPISFNPTHREQSVTLEDGKRKENQHRDALPPSLQIESKSSPRSILRSETHRVWKRIGKILSIPSTKTGRERGARGSGWGMSMVYDRGSIPHAEYAGSGVHVVQEVMD